MKKRYPKDWKQIRERILAREGHRCKFCRIPNYSTVLRDGNRTVKIILTIAHLHDHRPENCDDDNLAALCQQCHNRHDAKMRAEGRKQRRHYKSHDDLFDTLGPMGRAWEHKS